MNFPQDGIRYMEHEQRYTIPLPGGRVRAWFAYSPSLHTAYTYALSIGT